jgi:hypothetical protein
VSATVEVLPSYFDGNPGAAPPSEVAAPRSDRTRRIGILGTWTWESNRLGVEWFLREVLSHVDGECEVVIAGRGLQTDQLPARVRYLGFVESVEKFYRRLIVAIPSTAGGAAERPSRPWLWRPVVATDGQCVSAVRHTSRLRAHCEFTADAAVQGYDAVQAQAEHGLEWGARLQHTNPSTTASDVTHRTCVVTAHAESG